jgi:hypothetical protein
MGPEIIMVLASAGFTCLVIVAAIVITLIMNNKRGKPDYDKTPSVPKVTGKRGSPTAASASVADILAAALTKASPDVAAQIRAAKIQAVATDTFVAAMAKFKGDQQTRILLTLKSMVPNATGDAGVQAFVSQAIFFGAVAPPGQTSAGEVAESPYACPGGWVRCDHESVMKFNPNMDMYLNTAVSTGTGATVTKASRAFCCRFGNVVNDPDPVTRAKVQDNQRFVDRFFKILDLGLNVLFVFAGGVGDVLGTVVTTISGIASTGASISLMNGGDFDAVFDRSDPWMNCQGARATEAETFRKSNPNGIYRGFFKGKDGTPSSAYYQPNGCPLSVLPVEVAVYGEQIRNAYNAFANPGIPVARFKIIPFEKFDPKATPIWCRTDASKSKQYTDCMAGPASRTKTCGQFLTYTCDQRERTQQEWCQKTTPPRDHSKCSARQTTPSGSEIAYRDCMKRKGPRNQSNPGYISQCRKEAGYPG